ncbi:hypothetical protein D3C78_1017050 [compost metagenome]
MGAGQVAGVALAQTIDHRRIGLQQHALAQTADEHAGDLLALVSRTGFLFHQRGHDQRLVGLAIRQPLGALLPLLVKHAGQLFMGLTQQIDIAHAAHVAIGIGEETSFRMLTVETETLHHCRIVQVGEGLPQTLLGGQCGAQLAEGPALDQRQAVLHHVTALPLGQQITGGLSRRQAVLATVQALAVEIEAPVQAQPQRALQHPLVLETTQQASGRGSRRHLEQTLLGEHQGLLERHMLLPAGEDQQQACQHQAAFQQVEQKTFHDQASTRSASRPCSLRVSSPTGQLWQSSATTGQMPYWLLHRKTSSAASRAA